MVLCSIVSPIHQEQILQRCVLCGLCAPCCCGLAAFAFSLLCLLWAFWAKFGPCAVRGLSRATTGLWWGGICSQIRCLPSVCLLGLSFSKLQGALSALQAIRFDCWNRRHTEVCGCLPLSLVQESLWSDAVLCHTCLKSVCVLVKLL